MAFLPIEVLEYIYKYLNSLEDRKAASMVCQQWYRTYLNPSFRNLEVVNISNDTQFFMLANLENCDRIYLNFVITKTDITEKSLPFWQRYGPYMKTLVFRMCNIREPMFVNSLSYCTQLESLTIENCKELLMAGLLLNNDEDKNKLRCAFCNLKTLSFGYNRYLSDAILFKILALCPGINSLHLTGCQLSFHNGMFRRFYPEGLQTPSESVTTFQMILRFVSSNAKRIKALSFSDTLVDGTSLYNLSLTEQLELRALYLHSCMQISNDGFIKMCSTTNLSSLTELDVGLSPRINDTSLSILCSSLRQLKKFSLQGCRAISDMGLANIWQLDKLETLNLSECESIQGAGLLKGLCYKINYNILDIDLSYLSRITEAVVAEMVEKTPNLRHLNLSHCINAVTDLSIQAVFQYSKWLRSLDISMCDRVTDCGITGMGVSDSPIAPTAAQLLRLPLGSHHERAILKEAKIKEELIQLSEHDLLKARKTGISLLNIQGLQRLVLHGCYRITNLSLQYGFRLTELRKLDLSRCQEISGEGLKYLVQNCTALEELNLSRCHNVDNDAAAIILKHLPRLKSIFFGSDKITNDISSIFKEHSKQLTLLSLENCSKLSVQGLHFLTFLPSLKTFICPGLAHGDEGEPPPPPPKAIGFHRS